MESQERNIGLIKHLVNKLRRVTLAVQIMPFVYTGLYVVAMILYLFCSDIVCFWVDSLLYVSPLIISGFLVLSNILELCAWHRTACLLPFIPQVFVGIDYFWGLTEIESYISIITPAVMAILLLIAAYKVFFSNGCK